MKIVLAADADYINNTYAICECTGIHEGIEIPRKDYTEFVSFNCPRCGKKLGMVVLGKMDNIGKGEYYESN